MIVKRLATVALATAAFALVPAAGAFAQDPLKDPLGWLENTATGVYERLPEEVHDEVDALLDSDPGEVCIGQDENMAGRVCIPYSDSPLISSTYQLVVETAEQLPLDYPHPLRGGE